MNGKQANQHQHVTEQTQNEADGEMMRPLIL